MADFASALFASEADVDAIGKALETLLRRGDADEAAARLELALDALDELGHPIAALCRALPVGGIFVEGWEQLAYRIVELDKPGRAITAIGIDISWPGHVGLIPDEEGRLDPYLETNFYSDAAFAFSTSERDALLRGDSAHGSKWQGGFEDIDNTIAIAGMERVQGAAYGLHMRCRGGEGDEPPSPLDHDAMFIGMAFVAVRIHQAVREMVLAHGLPRPLTVLVGSNESYPFFDAPVITAMEYEQLQLEAQGELPPPSVDSDWIEEVEPAPSETGADEMAAEDRPQGAQVIALDLPETLTGSSLRRELRERAADAPVEEEHEPVAVSGGMLARLFRRR